MTELSRFVDEEGDEYVRILLTSASEDAPDPERRAVFLAALAPVAGTGSGSSGAGGANGSVAAGTRVLGAAGAKWIVVIGLASIVAFFVLRKTVTTDAEQSPEPISATEPAHEIALNSPAIETASTASVAAAIMPNASATANAPVIVAASGGVSSATASPPEVIGLAEETAMLDEARTALAHGDSKRALGVLDRYDRKAKNRILGQEATLVRIEALKAHGDGAAARALAQKFLAANPGSTYEDRVRALIADAPAP